MNASESQFLNFGSRLKHIINTHSVWRKCENLVFNIQVSHVIKIVNNVQTHICGLYIFLV